MTGIELLLNPNTTSTSNNNSGPEASEAVVRARKRKLPDFIMASSSSSCNNNNKPRDDVEEEEKGVCIENVRLALGILEHEFISRPQYDWGLFDYVGQEEEEEEEDAPSGFDLEESALMDFLTLDEIFEPIRHHVGPERAEHHHNPYLLHRDLLKALERMHQEEDHDEAEGRKP